MSVGRGRSQVELKLRALRRAAGIDEAFEAGWWRGVPVSVVTTCVGRFD
jgi:hypothetical protein